MLVEDMVRLSLIVKQENLQRPLILLGHNMGSFAGQQYVLDHSDLIDASPCPGPALSIDSCNSRSQRRQRPLRASAYTVRSVEPRSRVANAFMKAHCVSHGSNQWPTNLSFAASLKTCRPRPSSPDTLRFAHPSSDAIARLFQVTFGTGDPGIRFTSQCLPRSLRRRLRNGEISTDFAPLN